MNSRSARRAAWQCFGALGLFMLAAGPRAQTLVVATDSPLRSVDPFISSAPATRNFGFMVFDTLFGLDADGDIRAQMLSRHQVSADGKVWTFELREGLQFHDGSPVSADDVVASLLHWSRVDPLGQVLFDSVAVVRAIDPLRIEMRLTRPSGLLPGVLGKPGANVPFILPARLANKTEPITAAELVGSGPFKFEAAGWRPGADARFVRFAQYRARDDAPSGLAGGKRVGVDAVRWHAYADPLDALRALRAGKVDLIEHLRHDLVGAAPGMRIAWRDPNGEQLALRFNVLHPPFDDPRVRGAVAIALTQKPFLHAAVGDGDQAVPCASVFACRTANAIPAGLGPWLSGDIESARNLIRDAGQLGARVVLLRVSDVAVLRDLPAVAAAMLERIGLVPVIESMRWSDLQRRRERTESPAHGGWSLLFDSVDAVDIADPISNPWLNAACDQALFGWPCDDALQELRYRYALTPDATGRRNIAAAIEARLQVYPTYVPLGQWRAPSALAPGVDGEIVAPVPVYWGLRKAGSAR